MSSKCLRYGEKVEPTRWRVMFWKKAVLKSSTRLAALTSVSSAEREVFSTEGSAPSMRLTYRVMCTSMAGERSSSFVEMPFIWVPILRWRRSWRVWLSVRQSPNCS